MILVLKMTKKVSHNLILMSSQDIKDSYKVKKETNISGETPPPLSGDAQKKTFFLVVGVT